MRSEWQHLSLREAGISLIDCVHKTPEAKDDGYPYVTIPQMKDGRIDLSSTRKISHEDFLAWTVKAKPKAHDIVLSRRCNPGESAYVPEGFEFALGQNLVLLRSDGSKVHKSYLRWLVNSPFWWAEVQKFMNVGAVFTSLKCSDIPKFTLPIPSLGEQVKISEILSSLDDKIALNRQINQTLESMAQAIFKSWFVDFEPVKAKIAAIEAGEDAEGVTRAAMRAISGKTDDELDQMQARQPEDYARLKTTAELFPSAMQDSELGEVPEGWEVGILSDLIDFNPNRILKKGVATLYLDMKNVPTTGHLADDVILREMGSGTKFINGDTLLARITPCLENGKTAYVDFLSDGQVGWGSTEYIVMRPKNGIPTSFGYFVARLDSFRKLAIQSMTGTSGRQRANTNRLKALPWIKFPTEIIQAFDKIGGVTLEQAKSRGDKNKTLAQLRDTLLPKLLSGELSVDAIKITNEQGE